MMQSPMVMFEVFEPATDNQYRQHLTIMQTAASQEGRRREQRHDHYFIVPDEKRLSGTLSDFF